MYHVWPHENTIKKLIPVSEDVIELSSYIDKPWFHSAAETCIAPAVTLFKNRLGGRVAVFSPSITGYYDMELLNPKRKTQLKGVIEWIAGEAAIYAEHNQRCMLRYGIKEDENCSILLFINYTQDKISPLKIRIPDPDGITDVKILTSDGVWTGIGFENNKNSDLTEFTIKAELRNTLIMKIYRK
jgi:hypothetical protein